MACQSTVKAQFNFFMNVCDCIWTKSLSLVGIPTKKCFIMRVECRTYFTGEKYLFLVFSPWVHTCENSHTRIYTRMNCCSTSPGFWRRGEKFICVPSLQLDMKIQNIAKYLEIWRENNWQIQLFNPLWHSTLAVYFYLNYEPLDPVLL